MYPLNVQTKEDFFQSFEISINFNRLIATMVPKYNCTFPVVEGGRSPPKSIFSFHKP